MNEPLYPTPEAIEAALSAYDAQRPDGFLNDEAELFMEIMASNERLGGNPLCRRIPTGT